MESIVAGLAGNPLPTSIAVLIAIAAILGYYFFVLPLMDDHKKLKATNQELLDKLEDRQESDDGRLAQQLIDVQKSLQTLRESLIEGSSESKDKLLRVENFVTEISKTHSTFGKESATLQTQISGLSKEVQDLHSSVKTFMAGASARDDALDRTIAEVARSMHNVNEKQSQILGALYGMGRIQDRNRSI